MSTRWTWRTWAFAIGGALTGGVIGSGLMLLWLSCHQALALIGTLALIVGVTALWLWADS